MSLFTKQPVGYRPTLDTFRSQVIPRAGGVATELWTPTAGVAGQPRRTEGKNTYVCWIRIYNHSGVAVTAWLEIDGVVVGITYPLDNGQTATDDFPVPVPMGDEDIYCNASANDVDFQIGGYET